MANNLLIVFGGTTENTVVFPSNDSGLKSSRLFTKDELDSNHVDVLQINLLTINPSVSFFANKDSSLGDLNGAWLTAEPKGISRALKSSLTGKYSDPSLQSIAKFIEKANWSHANYTENSDARGMTVTVFNQFSRSSKDLIDNFLNNSGKDYDSVLMLAHSRGCGLTLQSLSQNDVNSTSDINDIQLSSDVLTGKLKRVVLLDPVSKNANNANEVIPPANAQVVAKLSQTDKEIHIVSKAKSTSKVVSTDYDSYVDVLVGAKESNDRLDFSNIYVHIADMVHEGMLSEELRGNFKKYLNIIMDKPWTQTYFNDQEVSAGNFLKLSKEIEVKDRRDAFKRCIQNKNGLA
ncbi:hypothetical protein PMG71_16850 [Roseofilum sp. BLCC_M154]|uniref:Uncharacterized protein n=1 Tax=Roseofilum acuticapitatum BLCC-M154 TaxID=3022444 RepID=A0ABT7AW32_9CYAN|nr:hypothetical protein [Roseofilum acuticapitatum]MDJ1171100.1 hypothetical protein [Roseofilum acuticapitatum BLCC-M154]